MNPFEITEPLYNCHHNQKGVKMFYFKRNLSVIERSVRVALGVCTAIAITVLAPTVWGQIVAYTIAATLAGTAMVGFCPAYALFGRRIK